MTSPVDYLRVIKRHHPRLWPVIEHSLSFLLEGLYRLALLPFRQAQGPGSTVEDRDLLNRADEYNAAAERYYACYPHPQALIDKPFSDPGSFPNHLIRAGTVMAAGRIQPGDTVVEVGAGTCWLSHFLNRYGCRTVAVDVSRTALSLGRRLFEREPATNWSLDPRFAVFDGRALPIGDAACDCVVVYDAFHHVPNQRALLAEMHRILRPRGIVVMSEPGVGHADTPTSLAEGEKGVLENELVIADIAALARAVGFDDTTLLASAPYFLHEVPAGRLGRFAGGAGFHRYWHGFSQALKMHHYILIYRAPNVPATDLLGDTKLRAAIEIESPAGGRARWPAGDAGRAVVSVENRSNALWLHAESKGWTRLGGHLFAVRNGSRDLVDFDWLRVGFAEDLEPERRVIVEVDLPAIERPGAYEVDFDVVVEGVTWFADRGSRPATLAISVE